MGVCVDFLVFHFGSYVLAAAHCLGSGEKEAGYSCILKEENKVMKPQRQATVFKENRTQFGGRPARFIAAFHVPFHHL